MLICQFIHFLSVVVAGENGRKPWRKQGRKPWPTSFLQCGASFFRPLQEKNWNHLDEEAEEKLGAFTA